ncbi:PqqD family peptide modification chaperone [Corynebacterium cystitidis]|uniref:PqqD family peptide modification chaperone n=1 Tax=Corynebacterium cystitidis TaxID=35757 RepID=UPI00358DA87D
MDSYFCLNPDVVLKETDYGSVALNKRTGQYWELNVMATDIFSMLNSGMGTKAIEETLVLRFNQPKSKVRTDLEELCNFSLSNGILRKSEA